MVIVLLLFWRICEEFDAKLVMVTDEWDERSSADGDDG